MRMYAWLSSVTCSPISSPGGYCASLLQLVSLLERAKEGPGSIGRKPIPHLTMSKPSTFDGSVVPFQEKTNRPLQPLSDSKAAEGKAHSELLDLSSLPTLGRQPLSAQRPLPTAQLDEKSLDDLLQDISGLSEESPKENPSRSAASRKKEEDDFHSDFEDDAVGNEFEDLNLAPDEVVKQKKKEMDVLFESNRIRPGDEGWQYDKEVDFGGSDVEGKLSCGWDNESGEDSDLVF